MPYLKKVNIHGNDYYYLFHTVRQDGKFHKLSKYLGKEKPSDEELTKLKQEFINDMKNTSSSDNQHHSSINVVAILQDIQSKKGYVPKEDIIQVSKELGIPAVDLFGVATFYSQFKLHKPGKYVISVCRGTACHVKNSESLLHFLEDELEIKPGSTTPDFKFTLETVNCIGACAKAPAIMINNVVYGELTKEKVKKIIASLQ